MSGNIEIEERRLIGMPIYSSKFLYSLSKSNRDTLNHWLNKGQGNIRSGPYRNRQKGMSDELPYYEVRRRLSQIQYNVEDYILENFKEQQDIQNDDILDWLSPIQEAIKQVLPGIELLEVKKTEDHKYILKFENRDGSIVKYNELSSGEKDAIALLFLLVEDEIEEQFTEIDIVDKSENDLVVLYDSPEAYLHPQLQLSFIKYVKDYLKTKTEADRNVQIVICTHSKMIIDNVPDESLYYLFYPDQVEENQLQSASNIPDELKTLISEEIGLTALSSGEDIMLVEGDDDREVFHRVDEDLHNDLSVIQMGGKKQIVELDDAFNKLVPNLKQSGVNLYAVVDRDRDLNLDRDVSDNIHTLPVTSIENIVLNPKAIFKTVEEMLGRGLPDFPYDNPEDIESLLEDIVIDQEFINAESQTRWNEQFNPFNLSYGSYEASNGFSNIESFAENEIQNKLSDVKEFSQIKEEVNQLAENGEIDHLDGKRILGEVSNEFGIKKDRLLRMCASRTEFQHLPEETRRFLQKIKNS